MSNNLSPQLALVTKILIIFITIALFFTFSVAQSDLADDFISYSISKPLAPTEKTTTFQAEFKCKLGCFGVDRVFALQPNEDNTITYDSIVLNVLVVDLDEEDPTTWTSTTMTLSSTQTISTGSSPDIPGNRLVRVWGTITFTDSQYKPDLFTDENIVTILTFQSSDATPRTIQTINIESSWTDELLLPNMPGVINPPTPDPTTFNFDFLPQTPPYYLLPNQNPYKFITTFVQYQWSFIHTLDLTLHGTNNWSFNSTALGLGLEFCTVNGQNIVPTVVNRQTLRLALPSFVSEALIASAPMTVMCGDDSNYIVQDDRILKRLVELGIPAPEESISILPIYVYVDGFRVPKLSTSVRLDQGQYQLLPYHRTDLKTLNISPESSFIDNSGKGIYSVFAVEFDTLDEYNQPFDLTLALIGLQLNPAIVSANPPQVLVTLAGDYTNEHPENKLVEVIHMLDLIKDDSGNTFRTKTLRFTDGFQSVYADGKTPNFFFANQKPKRFIQVTIPLDPMNVEYYPVSTLLSVIPVGKASTDDGTTVTYQPTLLALSTYQSSSTLLPVELMSWKINKVKRNVIKFDVTPMNSPQYFPDILSMSYPAGNLRLKYPSVSSPVCYLTVVVCSGSGKSRSCSTVRDWSYEFAPIHRSQYSFDVSAYSITGSVPGGYRTFQCVGISVESTKQRVLDFKGASGDLLETSKPVKTGGASDVKKTGVGTIVSTKLTNRGSLYGYSELSKVSNGISTIGIVMLCLIPVWLMLAAIPFIFICIFCCD